MNKINIIRLIVIIIMSAGFLPLAPKASADEQPWPRTAPPLAQGSLTGDEQTVITLALESINATWGDLGFRKDLIADSFRLDVAQQALDNPYFLVQWNYEWDSFLLTPKNTSDILLRAANDLDSDGYNSVPMTPSMSSVGRGQDFPLFPESIRQKISDLDMAVKLAQIRMDTVVLQSLTEDDREYLAWFLKCHFGVADDMESCPDEDEYDPPQEFLNAIRRYDLNALIATARELSASVDSTVSVMTASKSEFNIQMPVAVQGLSGTILVGSISDDVWHLAEWPVYSIIIDPGGNDVYYGQVASAGNLQGENFKSACVAIDLGGNDVYMSDGKRSCGSGVMGIAEMVDVDGDDTYRCGYFSEGCGLFGSGILIDRAGRDIYEGKELVQGAGAIGIGLLMDDSGNDSYRASVYAQGMGYTRGWGMLTDRDGFDSYWAGGDYDDFGRFPTSNLSLSQGFSIGMRPAASGGVGILHDRNGNDFYTAEVYGQGVSYWYSIGSLIDDNGNDWYQAEHYSQGSGIHLSSGILLDRGNGYDRYSSRGCTQGFGHDLAVGWLIDEGGDDYYTCNDIGQGTGITNSVGILVDRSGNDGYFAKVPTDYAGFGRSERNYGSIGIFVDMFGDDTYVEPHAGDGRWWTKGSWGAGVDVGDNWWNIRLDTDGNEVGRELIIPGI